MDDNHIYSVLDQPMVSQVLFHPRKSPVQRPQAQAREDMMIPVKDGNTVGASLHLHDASAPVLLFFHGNGEIVPDYDSLGPVFTRGAGVNFLVVDYRGYGDSSGEPGVRAMLEDSHQVLFFIQEVLEDRNMTGPLSVMGRSLGSAPALELAASYGDLFHCLIIESGFAYAGPLLRVLGLDPDMIGFREGQGMGNLDKMGKVSCPCLVIHAQFDHLIPFSDGQALYDTCPVSDKYLLEIKGANHNDIFMHGMAPYLEQVKKFCVG